MAKPPKTVLERAEKPAAGKPRPASRRPRSGQPARAAGLFTEEIKAEIRALAESERLRAEFENREAHEIVGFVVRNALAGKLAVVAGHNVAPEPQRHFHYAASDFEAAEEVGEIVGAYHTHPGRPPVPSEQDRYYARLNELPTAILSWPEDAWEVFDPDESERAALEGRPFVYGIFDCASLIVDYYAQHGVELPRVAHDPGWLTRGEDLYLTNLPKHGFSRVSDLREHDLILFALNSSAPNHAGVYVGDGLMLHHVQRRLSGTQPYALMQGYYGLNTHSIWRHEKFA
jgi:proteasome lid subunit RPN8/RPN11